MDAVIVAFASGKGGTGKSTTSVFVGGALAQMGKKVLLIELDSGLRSVDIIAGVSGQTVYDVEDVFSGRCVPAKAIVNSPVYPGLSLISAPYSGGVAISSLALKALCAALQGYFDYILIDTAAGLGSAFTAAVDVAQRVILVLTPDPVALRDGRLVADDLVESAHQVRLVLNRVDAKQILKGDLLRDLDEAIDLVGVQLLGVIPESAAIARASLQGDPLMPKSPEAKVFTAIASRIAGTDVPLVIH